MKQTLHIWSSLLRSHLFRPIEWRQVSGRWWQILLLGLMIALGIFLFPTARCAMGQGCADPADLWCQAGGPNQCCGPTNGFLAVLHCTEVRQNRQLVACQVSQTAQVGVRCYNPDDCGVTEVVDPDYGRLSGGVWHVGNCDWINNATGCQLNPDANPSPATCCSGPGDPGDPGNPPPCEPEYAPPSIGESWSVSPPYPLVWGQDTDQLGMTIHGITAQGGEDTECGEGRANITSIDVQFQLTDISIEWITGYLASRYYGAYVKGEYPAAPIPKSGYPIGYTGIGTPNAQRDYIYFEPLDPGTYDLLVHVCQSDGKCSNRTIGPVTVWLLDTTLGDPRIP